MSFKKILTVLKDYFKPKWDLTNGSRQLVDMFKRTGFSEKDFTGGKCIRLASLERLIKEKRLNKDLRWV